MPTRQELIVQTLQEVLGPYYRASGTYGLRWVRWSRSQPESVRKTHRLLRDLGLSDKQISDNVTLLAMPEQTIKKRYEFLNGLGLSKKSVLACPQLITVTSERLEGNYRSLCRIGLNTKVTQHPSLLYRSPRTLRKNLRFLKSKGLTKEKIVANALLLASDPQTIEKHWAYLKTKGLSDEKVAANAHLLQMSPRTIGRNYQNLRRLFKRDFIATYASLLGIPSETVENSVQFLYSLGIDAECCPLACLTSASTKRKKIAWMIATLFEPSRGNGARELDYRFHNNVTIGLG